MEEQSRKPYHKPEIVEVELVLEQAVLAACRNPTLSGPELSGGCSTAGQCKPEYS